MTPRGGQKSSRGAELLNVGWMINTKTSFREVPVFKMPSRGLDI